MSKKFVTQKEINFINRVNKELIQSVIGQEVLYYALLDDVTSANELYGESVRKNLAAPVLVNALVNWDNTTTEFTNFTADSKYSLDIYFHTLELQERLVKPREGDFVEFGKVFFEITAVTQPQIVFGHITEKIMTKCACVPSRQGQFQNGNDVEASKDNTHDTNQVIPGKATPGG